MDAKNTQYEILNDQELQQKLKEGMLSGEIFSTDNPLFYIIDANYETVLNRNVSDEEKFIEITGHTRSGHKVTIKFVAEDIEVVREVILDARSKAQENVKKAGVPLNKNRPITDWFLESYAPYEGKLIVKYEKRINQPWM